MYPKQDCKWLERMRTGDWVGVFMWLEDRTGMNFPGHVFNLPPLSKDGAPGLSYHLAQIRGRRGKGNSEV